MWYCYRNVGGHASASIVSGAKTKEVKNKVSGGGRIDVAGSQKAASEMMDLMMPKGFKTGKKNDEEGKPTKAKKEQARADMFRLIFYPCMHALSANV